MKFKKGDKIIATSDTKRYPWSYIKNNIYIIDNISTSSIYLSGIFYYKYDKSINPYNIINFNITEMANFKLYNERSKILQLLLGN